MSYPRNPAVKLHLHYVTNGKTKVRVWYWKDRDHKTGAEHITVSSKDYGYGLDSMFPGVRNDTDILTDYFDKSRVRLTPESPYWNDALAMVQKHEAWRAAVYQRRETKRLEKRGSR